MTIKEMINTEKPRERLEIVGVENLSAEELIAILLRTGTKKETSKALATKILTHYNNINELSNASINSLTKLPGIGKAKATSLIAAIELGKRVHYQTDNINPILKNGDSIYEYMYPLFKNKKQEYFYALYLDSKLKLITKKMLFKGTLNNSSAHPREIFKEALLESAAFIIVVHNHPSGDPTPSSEDSLITKTLFETGSLIGIPVIDHIIIGENSYYSFYNEKKETN